MRRRGDAGWRGWLAYSFRYSAFLTSAASPASTVGDLLYVAVEFDIQIWREWCCKLDVVGSVVCLVRFARKAIQHQRRKSRLSRHSCLVDLLSFRPGSGQRPLCRQGTRINVDSLQGSSPDTRMKGVRAARCLNDEFKCPGMGSKGEGVSSPKPGQQTDLLPVSCISRSSHDLPLPAVRR